MPRKPTYDELQQRVAELESQQQQQLHLLTEIARRKQSEKDLFNADERLSTLMNSLPVAVSFSDDVTCQRITGNPALLAQFEITPSDNISASASDPAAAGRNIRFFQDGREIQEFELPLQRAVAENREISQIDLRLKIEILHTPIMQSRLAANGMPKRLAPNATDTCPLIYNVSQGTVLFHRKLRSRNG